MQRCALFCLLLAGTFAASVYGQAPVKAAPKAVPAPVVCDVGLPSTYEALATFNKTAITPFLMNETSADFKGTIFIPTQKALNATLFELFLTPLKIVGPLPPNILPEELLADFLPFIAKYHVIPNVVVDPSKLTAKDYVDGVADIGPLKSLLTPADIPSFEGLCSEDGDSITDVETFGMDVGVSIVPDSPVVAFGAGTSANVNATTPTCGGIIHLVDGLALMPCLPSTSAATHAALVKAITDKVAKANATYIKSLSAAPTTAANAMLTVAVSCIAMLALAFGL